jgi:hypothetical protein
MYEGTRYGPPQHARRDVQEPDAYNTTTGRRDKSTAVGRGACGWLDWIFLSAPTHALPPLNTKSLRNSTVAAPSADIFTRAGPR